MNVMALDIELNQLNKPRTIQIGAAIFKASTGELIESFETFVNPNEPITEFITELTSITDEDVKDAPNIREAFLKLQEFHKKHKCFMNPIVWGSGSSNDSLALWQEAYSLEERRDNPNFMGHRVIDAKTLFQSVQIFRNKKVKAGLAAACERLGIPFEGRAHTALADAINTFKCWFALTERLDRGELKLGRKTEHYVKVEE